MNVHPRPLVRRFDAAVQVAARHPLLTIAVMALVPRLVLAAATFASGKTIVGDEAQYFDLARSVASGKTAEEWFPQYGQSLYDSTWAFVAPLRLAFDVLWPSRIIGQLWAVTFGVVVSGLTYVLATFVVPRRWALAAGLAVAVLPSQILWSSIVLRESLVWTGLVGAAIGVAIACRATLKQAAIGGAIVVASLLLLGALRDQTMLAATYALPIGLLVGAARHRLVLALASIAIVVIVPLWSDAGVAGWELIQRQVPSLQRTRTNLAIGADSAFTGTTLLVPATTTIPKPLVGYEPRPYPMPVPQPGSPVTTSTLPSPTTTAPPTTTTLPPLEPGQSYIQAPSGTVYVVEETARSNLRAIPNGAVAVLLRPFPWEISGSSTPVMLAGFENIIWYLAYALAVLAVLLAWRRLRTLAYPVVALAAVLGMAFLTQGNLGTSFRHRGQLFPFFAVLAVVAVHALMERRRAASEFPAPARVEEPALV